MSQRPDYLNMKSNQPQAQASALSVSDELLVNTDTRKVLRNTYALLSMTLLFSAGMATLSMMMNWPHPGLIITLVAYFGLLFAVSKFQNSALGIVAVFALTGFMGATLGPMLNAVVNLSGGTSAIGMALASTGGIFLIMATWVTSTGKDLSGAGKFLMAGVLIAFVCGLGAMFFEIPALALAVSAMFVLLSTALIAYEISAIIHGGQTNYIMATVSLYVSLFNLFVSLLNLFMAFGGSDD